MESGEEKPVDTYQEWVIPKLAKDGPAQPPMKGAVIPPPSEPTPKEELETEINQIEDPGKTFDGKCLKKR